MDTGMTLNPKKKKRTKRFKFRVPYFVLGMIAGTLVGIGLIVIIAEFVI